jgi:hypothetical protein
MGIGKLKCAVIDVEDLHVAEAFWAEVTGLSVIPSPIPGRYSYLGQPDPWDHQLILHLVKTRKGEEPNRGHVDIWVRDIDQAIPQIESIGGRLKWGPTIYPRPGSFPGEPPLIDWAVMQDPFGNEFCLVTLLSPDESRAVEQAASEGAGDDHRWRVAAGRTAETRKA